MTVIPLWTQAGSRWTGTFEDFTCIAESSGKSARARSRPFCFRVVRAIRGRRYWGVKSGRAGSIEMIKKAFVEGIEMTKEVEIVCEKTKSEMNYKGVAIKLAYSSEYETKWSVSCQSKAVIGSILFSRALIGKFDGVYAPGCFFLNARAKGKSLPGMRFRFDEAVDVFADISPELHEEIGVL